MDPHLQTRVTWYGKSDLKDQKWLGPFVYWAKIPLVAAIDDPIGALALDRVYQTYSSCGYATVCGVTTVIGVSFECDPNDDEDVPF